MQKRKGILPDADIDVCCKRLGVSRGDGNRSATCGDHFRSSMYPCPESNDATLIYTTTNFFGDLHFRDSHVLWIKDGDRCPIPETQHSPEQLRVQDQRLSTLQRTSRFHTAAAKYTEQSRLRPGARMRVKTRREGTNFLCRVFHSPDGAHKSCHSIARIAAAHPPIQLVYARAGLVHTSPRHNWSAYVVPRADSWICKSKV